MKEKSTEPCLIFRMSSVLHIVDTQKLYSSFSICLLKCNLIVSQRIKRPPS